LVNVKYEESASDSPKNVRKLSDVSSLIIKASEIENNYSSHETKEEVKLPFFAG